MSLDLTLQNWLLYVKVEDIISCILVEGYQPLWGICLPHFLSPIWWYRLPSKMFSILPHSVTIQKPRIWIPTARETPHALWSCWYSYEYLTLKNWVYWLFLIFIVIILSVPPLKWGRYFLRRRWPAWSFFVNKGLSSTFKSVRPLVYTFICRAVFAILRRHVPINYFGVFWCAFVGKVNNLHKMHGTYEGCPESVRPFWISREWTAWPWCNLVPSRRRPYCTSLNSHSPLGLVSRQWEAVDWACVLYDRRIHNDRASR